MKLWEITRKFVVILSTHVVQVYVPIMRISFDADGVETFLVWSQAGSYYSRRIVISSSIAHNQCIMSGNYFPSLLPKISDPVWFNVDKPCDDENELTKLEEEHQNWVYESVMHVE